MRPKDPLGVVYIWGKSTFLGEYFQSQGERVLFIPYEQIMEWDSDRVIASLGGKPQVVLACPICSTYSIAGLGYHRIKKEGVDNLFPRSPEALLSDQRNQYLLNLILMLSPQIWVIENPRGGLRKMDFMRGLPRYTTTYCQYGDSRMKPTDFWTNHPSPGFKPPCKNGDPCHQSAPRGSRRGTQGLRTKSAKADIPKDLCSHIYGLCKNMREDI